MWKVVLHFDEYEIHRKFVCKESCEQYYQLLLTVDGPWRAEIIHVKQIGEDHD